MSREEEKGKKNGWRLDETEGMKKGGNDGEEPRRKEPSNIFSL